MDLNVTHKVFVFSCIFVFVLLLAEWCDYYKAKMNVSLWSVLLLASVFFLSGGCQEGKFCFGSSQTTNCILFSVLIVCIHLNAAFLILKDE